MVEPGNEPSLLDSQVPAVDTVLKMWAGLRNQTLVSREPSHLFTLLAGGAQCLLTPWVRMPEAPQESQPEIGCMGLEEVPTSRNCVKYHPPMET